VPRVRHQGFEIDQRGLRVVGGAGRLGEEELDGPARAPCDVFEGWQRRPRAAVLDQVDGRRGDMALAQLGKAQAGLETRLLDRAGAKIDAGKSASLGVSISRRRRFSAPAGHESSLYTKP